MKLKIIHRSAIIWNIILYFLLSLVFVYLQEAVYQEKSIFDDQFLKKVFLSYWPVSLLVFISSIFVFNLHKASRFFYIASVLTVSACSAYLLATEFSKLILIVLFIYLLVSYYLFFLLKSDLDQALYNPNYSYYDLFSPMLYHINVTIEDLKTNQKINGLLTNWDEESCFVKCDEEFQFKGQVNLVIHFRGHDFEQKSLIVTTTKKLNGVGLKFLTSKTSEKNWMNVYNIMNDRGLNVEYVK